MSPRQRESADISHAEAVEELPADLLGAYMADVFSDAEYLAEIFEKGVFTRIEALALKEGFRPPSASLCASSEGAIAFAQAFSFEYQARYNKWLLQSLPVSDEPPLSKPYRLLLLAANVARASAWQDWRVERDTRELSRRLGLQSIPQTERAIAFQYGSPGQKHVHLVKGPGDGKAVEAWNDQGVLVGPPSEHESEWMRMGVGDRIYFDIFPILENFIRPELQAQPKENQHAHTILTVICHALQHRLRERWAPFLKNQQPQSSGPKGKKKKKSPPHFFDLNEIFILLRDPQFFDGIEEFGYVFTSDEFVNEKRRLLSLREQRAINAFRGGLSIGMQTQGEISEFTKEHMQELYMLRSELALALRSASPQDISFSPWLQEELEGVTPEQLPEKLRDLQGHVEEQLTWVATINQGERPSADKARMDEGESRKTLEKYFTPEFLEAIRNGSVYQGNYYASPDIESIVDLNTRTDFSAHNFIPGHFIDMPKMFEGNADGHVGLITAVRSCSHEPQDVWQKDVRQNLDLLAPGGLLVVDGHRESYSRRLRTITRLPKNFHQSWCMSKEGDPLSLAIQRKPGKSSAYLHDDEALQKDILAEGVTLQDPAAVLARRHDLRILDNARRKLIDSHVLKDREDFSGIHTIMVEQVRIRLLNALCRNILSVSGGPEAMHVVTTSMRTGLEKKSAEIAKANEAHMPDENVRLRVIRRVFGDPQVQRKMNMEDAVKKCLEKSHARTRKCVMEFFHATGNKGQQNMWQVKEVYDGLMNHAMTEAIAFDVLEGMPFEEAEVLLQDISVGKKPETRQLSFGRKRPVMEKITKDVIRYTRLFRVAQSMDNLY